MHHLFRAALAVCACSPGAFAADPAQIELFGTSYRVQRFDYSSEITFANPLDGVSPLQLSECEGVHWLGNGRVLLSSNEMDNQGSYANIVVEAAVLTNAAGTVTGFQFVRVVVVNDIGISAPPFDLDPSGITINAGTSGLGAGGQLVVADSENERLRAYDLATGQVLGGDFPTTPANDELEDVAWIADPLLPGAGAFYTVHQGAPYSIEVFAADGVHLGGFPIADAVHPGILGEPKGLGFIADVAAAPAPFHGKGGALLVALADNGPALQAFDRSGVELGYEPLEGPGGGLLDAGAQPLQIEAVAFDPDTGRLFLVQQGTVLQDNYVWVLTPCEEEYGAGCAGSGGFVPRLSLDGCLVAGEVAALSVENGFGGGIAVIFFGAAKANLHVAGQCALLTAPLLPASIVVPVGGSGAGAGSALVGGIVPAGLPAAVFYSQAFLADPGALVGFSASNGLGLHIP